MKSFHNSPTTFYTISLSGCYKSVAGSTGVQQHNSRGELFVAVLQHLDNALTKFNFVRHCPDCFLFHPGSVGTHQSTGLNSDRTYPICKLFLTLKYEKLCYSIPLFSILLRFLDFSTALLQVGLLLRVLYRISSLNLFRLVFALTLL